MILILHRLFQKMEERTISISFYKASITTIPKPKTLKEKEKRKKKKKATSQTP